MPPADPSSVGWWQDGAVPGRVRGWVVITGHPAQRGVGAFDELGSLDPGDAVVETGRARSAIGSGLARRSARLFDPAAPARLVLATCDDWDGSAYRSNAVVTARPV